jgi:hypothetical protein
MKQYIGKTLSIFTAFVLVSGLLSINGSVYSQETTNQSQTNATGNAEHGETENAEHDATGNATSGHVVRDSATVLLEGVTIPAGSFIHLYDTTPYKIVSGHVAAKLPCNTDNSTDVNVLVGQAPKVSSSELEFVSELSNAGELCLYHVDLASDSANAITDIAIQNNSTGNINFPATSTVVIGINEISELSPEAHGHTS